MARARRIYILMIKVNKLFSFFLSRCFLKEIESMFSVFLSSYRNTRESLGELDKAVEQLACSSCSHSISCSLKLPLLCFNNSITTQKMNIHKCILYLTVSRALIVLLDEFHFWLVFSSPFKKIKYLI